MPLLSANPAAASSEWLAEFRIDIREFVPREIVLDCVTYGDRERLCSDKLQYSADPSGGSSNSMALAIAHRDHELTVVDVVTKIPAPVVPENAVGEFTNVPKSYRISSVTGDRYDGEWPR